MRARGSITLMLLALAGTALAPDLSQAVFKPALPASVSRIGHVTSGWLLFVTGGCACARPDADAATIARPAPMTFTLRESGQGWTVGTGIGVKPVSRGSGKPEYL